MLKAYDPEILGQFSQRLLRRADSILAIYFLAGLAISVVVFYSATAMMLVPPVLALAASALVWILCVSAGYERAFSLRVQAHTVLCQVAIEMNTRQMVITSQMQATRPSV